MSGPDVRDLAGDELQEAQFPSNPHSDFRLYLSPDVQRGTWSHAKQDTSVEICGVLVGRWEKDENGPYAVVTDFIRCERAASKFAEVTFTHESWAQINDEMDSQFADSRIVGWYHSHPDFGVFLSDRDCFIHEHFFSNPGQVAYVIDPVRDIEGMFAWQAGKPTPLGHYWIGDRIEAGEYAGKTASTSNVTQSIGRELPVESVSQRPWLQDLLTMLLTGLLFFGAGYFIANQRSSWERQMVQQGAVAHYGINQLMKLGIEDELSRVDQQLGEILQSLEAMPDPGEKLDDDGVKAATALRRDIEDNLAYSRDAVTRIEGQYGMTDAQRQAILWIVAERQAALNRARQAATKSDATPETGNKASTAANDESDKSTDTEDTSAEAPPTEVKAPANPE